MNQLTFAHTPKKHQATIQKILWLDIRDAVNAVNPTLSKLIDAIDPDKKFPLFKATYPFGATILDKGIFHLPSPEGKIVPITSLNNPDEIKAHLNTRFVPVSLILNKSAEVFFELESRIVSLNFLGKGSFFGLWEALDPPNSYFVKNIWSIVAGARSLFMLPKITDANSHRELRKKYGVRSHLPKTQVDHWKIFIEIANSQNFDEEWGTDILFFPDSWLNSKQSSKSWLNFRTYLLEYSWRQSQYWRNKVTFDFIWELFTTQLIQQNIKANPYLVKIVKHLVLVGIGVLPGFTVADNSNISAPIEGLQRVYAEDYKLKDYMPIIMEPHHFNFSENIPVYYSFLYPTLLETTPTSQNIPSILNSMLEIEFLTETFRLEVHQKTIDVDNTPINIFTEKVNCDYFHSDVDDDSHRPILPTKLLSIMDKRFIQYPQQYKNRQFSETAQFIRACVKLALKE